MTRRPPDAGRARVVVLAPAAETGDAPAAAAWAERLGLPLCDLEAVRDEDLVLAAGPRGLELRGGDAPGRPGVRVDLSRRAIARGGGRPGHAAAAQPLRRAVGRGSGLVVDATAGFGDDAVAIASWGRRVLALERAPVVAALLEDGCARARRDEHLAEIASRIEVRCAEAVDVLAALEPAPEVVYVDPMYERPRARSALPRRKIQLLQRLVGRDADAAALLEVARATGAARVVVKRALRAEPLAPGVSASHRGKLVRYDVYRSSGA